MAIVLSVGEFLVILYEEPSVDVVSCKLTYLIDYIYTKFLINNQSFIHIEISIRQINFEFTEYFLFWAKNISKWVLILIYDQMILKLGVHFASRIPMH